MPAAYRVRNSYRFVSAKVTIRDIDGTEYQLKARIGQMIVDAGYACKIKRGLISMLSMTFANAIRIVANASTDPRFRPIGPPGCSLAVYPATHYETAPRPFGFAQDWSRFPVNV